MKFIFVTTVFSIMGYLGADVVPLELSDKEIQRVKRAQHNLDLEVEEFQKNLEGLKTTVEFPVINI